MTVTDVAPPTIPTRTNPDDWHVDEIVTTDDGTRWKIRALNPGSGRVVLSSMNVTNADIWWNTTVDKLPGKAAK
ncbi:hypothetical protein [Microbacterium aurantiacum]|uniref:Uncharacterized protein n=1 Tax=Microbacterium aurantiacum TaxID=162393 RepID=A0ABT8FRH5_9MICO|nr:hypothetical protein [Microbacterium aurantiacum]MDN4463923.1 hypothetical protein [Microbacterium aurantiacum]